MAANNFSLDDLIKQHNPFQRELFEREVNVWQKAFPDYEPLNAHASEAVLDAVNKINSNQRDVLGITIRSEKGLGKTHNISRIRRKLKESDNALFVYMSKYSNPEDLKAEFLTYLVSSFKEESAHGITQWQKIATCIINSLYSKNYQSQQFIKTFSHPKKQPPLQRNLNKLPMTFLEGMKVLTLIL
ncbi:MAG: hypothetical protein HC799_14200 [Limnothrix sp. RL_2_0]|nr:hypothetical protein [Limnothrix sp. RL_2_0]